MWIVFPEATTQNNKQDYGFQWAFKEFVFIYDWVSVCLPRVCRFPRRPWEGVAFPGAGVSGDVDARADVNSSPLQERSMPS